MRQKLLLYINGISDPQISILKEAVANLSKTLGINTITQDNISQETDEFSLYSTLFEKYVGYSRTDYLSSLLDKDTYIITLNRNVDMVYGVLKRINPKFDKSRIYSVRGTYEHFQIKNEQIPKIEMAIIIKVSKIFQLLKEGKCGLFVDDTFPEYLFERAKTRSHSKYKNKNLEYFYVDKEKGMNGLEKEHIDKQKDITKYQKIFLDFDDTITKETNETLLLNTREYTYGNFLKLGLQ
jgi:hypothetical protein